jgi:serine/threonine protein kinase
MAVSRPPTLAVGTLVLERYSVVSVVGQGGLGTVYQVRDDRFGHSNIYALKETFDLSDGAREQFEREARWLERLDHPNIPRVRHYFEWSGRLYLVMDFVSGENLEHKLLHNGQRPLPEAEVIRWLVPISDALAYLHGQVPPIIHRDVKPANIIVTAGGHPALVDLGIAKEHLPGMPNITATFIRKAGTEGYAPPEQYTSNGTTGPWSDIYSLGATMYHLLTGHVPSSAIERAALDGQLIAPRALNPAISPAAEAVIVRALAIRPGDRFPSMRDMHQALAAAARTQAVSSQASPTCPRCGRAMLTPAKLCAVCAAEEELQAARSSHGQMPVPLQAPRSQPIRRAIRRPGDTGAAIATPPPARAVSSASFPRSGASSFPGVARPRPQPTRRRLVVPWQAIAVLAAALLLSIGILLGAHIISLGTMDESTPQATLSGYMAALQNQDYHRAYAYLSTQMTSTETYDAFAQAQQNTNSTLGTIQSFHIASIATVGPGSDQVTVTIDRSGSSIPETITFAVSQQGGDWLIDDAPSS